MTLDGLDCFEFFQCFYFPASILRAIHSIDICTVKIKNIRNMYAILTNQITDIWHFNDKLSILFTDDILLFVEYLKTFSRNNFLICPPSWLEGGEENLQF